MKKGTSIQTRVVIATILFMGTLTAAIAVIGYKLYDNNVTDNYITYADTVLEYAYREAVDDSFGDIIAGGEETAGYLALRAQLDRIKDSSNIEYLYAIYFEDVNAPHSLHYAINTKTAEELAAGATYTKLGTPCEPGAFEDDTIKTLQEAVLGNQQENGFAEGYSDEYGHMLIGYRVIDDSAGQAVGLLCVEIDTNRITLVVHRYVRIVILVAAIFTAIIIILYILNLRRYLLGPLVRIAAASDSFVKEMKSGVKPEELIYEAPPVESGGELFLLSDNVKNLADGVAGYMVNLRAATAEKERIGTELSLATRIQADMLPNIYPPFPERSEFDIYATMTPAKEVGGDFYNFFLVDDDHLCVLIADVSGKGVPAALFMMASMIILSNHAMLGKSPAQILEDTNETICANNREEMFVTVWIGILTISTGRLVTANAGHEYPTVYTPGGEYTLIKDKHGFVIGGMEGIKYKEQETNLAPGAKVFVYTDGVPEATNANKELFGTERMLSALNRDKSASTVETLKNVRAAVDDFVQDAEQFDDLTMLCLEYRGTQGKNS